LLSFAFPLRLCGEELGEFAGVPLSGFVMTAVLFAALLHASWNAVIKSGESKVLDIEREIQ